MLTQWRRVIRIDGLVQDCSNSIANALELLQSCTKPSMYALVNGKPLLEMISTYCHIDPRNMLKWNLS